MTQPFDLSAFTSVDTLDVTIQHPAFPVGAEPVITLAGPNHPATLAADKARQSAIMKARGKVDGEALATEHTAARVVGLRNVVLGGKELQPTIEDARALLTAPNLKFIRLQVFAALGDDESFFTA